MASLLIFLLAVFSLPLLTFQESTGFASSVGSQTESRKNHDSLISEIQEAKLKLAQLKSIFDKTIQDLNAKSVHIRQSEKKIQEMNQEIDRLQTALASFEENISSTDKNSRPLEEQVQLLWAASRQNNFEIYNLEYKARDAEERLNMVTTQVEEMADIVSEQWTQIQQLEQALQMAQLRASKVKRQLRTMKCPLMKSIQNLFGEHLEMLRGILDPYVSYGGNVLKTRISEASDHLKKTSTAVKYYHHQLQGYIKQTMLTNEFTAVLANDEVVFFLVVHCTKSYSFCL